MTLQLIGQALGQIRLHPLRSFLAVLGTMNGIMSVVMVVAISDGHRSVIKQHFDELGANLLVVSSYVWGHELDSVPTEIRYSMQDMIRIKNACRSVKEVAPVMRGSLTLQYERRSLELHVTATDARYVRVRNLTVKKGRFLSPLDIELDRRVVVLNETAARRLLGSDDLNAYRELLVQGTSVAVIGIVEDRVTEAGSGMPTAYLPMAFYSRLVKTYSDSLGFYILIHETFDLEQGMKEVQSILKETHGPTAVESVSGMTEFLAAFRDISRRAIWALAVIASITLLLSGIGISNLLLASVRERTREIGVRKALGAKDRAILFQFVIEGIVLSVLGGIFGVLLGVGGLVLVLPALELPVIIPYHAVIVGVLFSIGVGFLASYYPAKIAARLRPIEALRYE